MVGIYKITSPNDKVYIGQSINIEKRFNDYKLLRSNRQILLHRSLLKYGVENHKFEILEECLIFSLNKQERYWQDYYNVLDKNLGLNLILTETDELPRVVSEETRKKISLINKGRLKTQSQKELISKRLKEYYSLNVHPLKNTKRGTVNNKLKVEQVLQIRDLLLKGDTVLDISKLFNISKATIQQIKSGKTWQSLGEFSIEGRTSRLKKEDLNTLYKLFDLKIKVKDIQKVLPYCIGTIAKQRKLWKKMKITD